jgi:hypothetical protein
MLTIKNIDSLKDTYIGHWKIHLVQTNRNYYNIKVVHNGSPFDMFNLCVERQKTKHGDYRLSCFDNGAEGFVPIECIRDRDNFIRFLIDELI